MDDLLSSDISPPDEIVDRDSISYLDQEITQEDAWVVIGVYFKEKGLVLQQTDSFDKFASVTLPEIVADSGQITVTPVNQYIPGRDVQLVRLSL